MYTVYVPFYVDFYGFYSMGLYSIIFYHSEKEKSICEGEF
ncbi:hypothetical protein EUBSIR_02258 [[Eubacterium] siraeum DSM 15702]|uniref:Uncharacterized protein n=1 Tax=[Eubacterium] siraeum DSM 15702 TaxID=428128 RepID=B0MQZ1_9FIRM|nr:hypothetical protein EUBSIR_02258 [[Eubacterium] siraeum DSM 15702]